MKNLLFTAILMTTFAVATQAQSSDTKDKTVWNAPKACEAVKAEQNASNHMSPGMKALYNSTSSDEDKLGKAALNIYCNPPKAATPAPAPAKTGRVRAM